MSSKPYHSWIPIEKVESLLQIEPALMIIVLAIASWVIYRFFLRSVSDQRHRNLKKLFANLLIHAGFWLMISMIYLGIHYFSGLETPFSERLSSYLGFTSLIWGSVVFVKTARILLFEYLFLGHMRAGVPILLVNIFTLLLSVCIAGWLISEIFNVRLAPFLATSAIFSIVLGLALQDTLGNLFAGMALQFDKPYEIGDWIEIQSNNQKWAGQVFEVSWRATVLLAMTDEIITVPNRVVAQAEVSNFSVRARPFIRSQVFRVPYGTPIEKAKQTLLNAALSIEAIRKGPSPSVYLTEATESWIVLKLIYFIDDYGSQIVAGDRVLDAALKALAQEDIELASPRLSVIRS